MLIQVIVNRINAIPEGSQIIVTNGGKEIFKKTACGFFHEEIFSRVENEDDALSVFSESISERHNGSIVDCCVYDYMYPETEYPECGEIVYRDEFTGHVCKKGVDILGDWLHENGADIHENVLIKYWIA